MRPVFPSPSLGERARAWWKLGMSKQRGVRGVSPAAPSPGWLCYTETKMEEQSRQVIESKRTGRSEWRHSAAGHGPDVLSTLADCQFPLDILQKSVILLSSV